MNVRDGTETPDLQRPTNEDKRAWKAYWKKQGQPWRTEPEINVERQKYLAERLNILVDIAEGIYPFKDIKLSRADVEWLLATEVHGNESINWKDNNQWEHEGLDLRGADLRRMDLSSLPLAWMRGGLNVSEWKDATLEQRELAAIHLEGANLWDADLEEAFLRGAHLEATNLRWVRLKGASLREVHLERADLRWAHLEGAFLQGANLEGADLNVAHLEKANLKHAHLEGKLTPLNLLNYMQQWNQDFPAILPPTNLRLAFFDSATQLRDIIWGNKEHGFVLLADVNWGDVNLTVVDWSLMNKVGDEQMAQQSNQVKDYQAAIRANRQLALALQAQGINEDAARFAYRAQKLQRVVLRRQRKFGSYLFSGFIDLLAGYGYRPGRSIFWYLVIIVGFALAYYALGHLSLFPPDAFVYSLTSFHGRGFFPGIQNKPSLHDPLVMLAAIEAVIGLFIEISFIATFTKRFFGS